MIDLQRNDRKIKLSLAFLSVITVACLSLNGFYLYKIIDSLRYSWMIHEVIRDITLIDRGLHVKGNLESNQLFKLKHELTDQVLHVSALHHLLDKRLDNLKGKHEWENSIRNYLIQSINDISIKPHVHTNIISDFILIFNNNEVELHVDYDRYVLYLLLISSIFIILFTSTFLFSSRLTLKVLYNLKLISDDADRIISGERTLIEVTEGGFETFETRAVTKAINKLIIESYRSARDNQSLLRVISHDLSNIMNVGSQGLQVFKMKLKADERQQLISSLAPVERAYKIQKDILENIKQLQLSESGKEELKLQCFNLYDLFDNTYFIFHDKIRQKEIEYVMNLEETDELYVIADPVILSNQVINNLISNAIKFVEIGGKIEISAIKKKETLTLIIEDNGTGIDRSTLDKIFDPLAKTSHVGTGGERGTGFGMPIVKTYMDKFNGSISIESKHIQDFPDDHGTTITLVLKQGTKEAMTSVEE